MPEFLSGIVLEITVLVSAAMFHTQALTHRLVGTQMQAGIQVPVIVMVLHYSVFLMFRYFLPEQITVKTAGFLQMLERLTIISIRDFRSIRVLE